MRFVTDGLVLKTADVGESDRVITVLTKDYGVIRAFANGAKKFKNSKQSATQTLCYSHFSFYQNKDSFIIDDAQSIETFFRLRDDIEKLALAQYFCELACETAPEYEDSSEYLSLVLNCLYMLSTGRKEPKLLKAIIEMRMLTMSGYMPSLEECRVCGKKPESAVCFDTEGGSIHCEACAGRGVLISPGVLNSLRHICCCEKSRIFSFELTEPSLSLLSQTSEKYLRAQLKHRFSALDFYNGLFR